MPWLVRKRPRRGRCYPCDVLEDMRKREELSEITNWPTLPKIFINGKFYGDTDILGPMAESGELQKILEETFGEAVQPKTTINLH